MAQQGVRRSPTFAKDGTKPENTSRQDLLRHGRSLITDQPQTGVSSHRHHLRPAELLGLTVLRSSRPDLPAGRSTWRPGGPHGKDVHRMTHRPAGARTTRGTRARHGRRAPDRIAGPAHPARPARPPDPGTARGPAPVDHRVLDHQRPVPLGGQPLARARAGHGHRRAGSGPDAGDPHRGHRPVRRARSVFTSVIMANLAHEGRAARRPAPCSWASSCGLAWACSTACWSPGSSCRRSSSPSARYSIFFSLNSVVSRARPSAARTCRRS